MDKIIFLALPFIFLAMGTGFIALDQYVNNNKFRRKKQ